MMNELLFELNSVVECVVHGDDLFILSRGTADLNLSNRIVNV